MDISKPMSEGLKVILSEYGLAVFVLIVFIIFLGSLVRALNKQRIEDREERKEAFKLSIEAQERHNKTVSNNTDAIRKLESNLTYLMGMVHSNSSSSPVDVASLNQVTSSTKEDD